MIQDNGVRRKFDTGAVRDIAEGKGRCDLLPLGIIADILDDNILRKIHFYLKDGDPDLLMEVIYRFATDVFGDRVTWVLEVSKHYEEGCIKYGERNWEKGIPLHCYIDSGVRHYIKYLRGDKDERHDRAFLWNMLGAIWTQAEKPELNDLPFDIKGELP